jgi:hypothetical protein
MVESEEHDIIKPAKQLVKKLDNSSGWNGFSPRLKWHAKVRMPTCECHAGSRPSTAPVLNGLAFSGRFFPVLPFWDAYHVVAAASLASISMHYYLPLRLNSQLPTAGVA